MPPEPGRIFWSDGAGGVQVIAASPPDPLGPASGAGADRPSRTAVAVGVGLGALALARHGLTQQGLLAAGLLPVLAVLAGIDLRCRLLPNRIVLPALGAVIVWQIGFAPQRTGEWLGAAVGAALFLAVPSLLRPGAVGMGDVKLAALLGAALGAEVAGALLIGLVAMAPVALIVLWRGGRQATLPMGPCLAFGAAVLLLA